MLDLSKYRDVKYDDADYNCLHFACSVYRDLTGIDLSSDVTELCQSRRHRHVCPDKLSRFVLIDNPKTPCIAVMRSPVSVHCGVYINGAIVHLDETGIKSQQPHIAKHQYQSVKYYDYNAHPPHTPAVATQNG